MTEENTVVPVVRAYHEATAALDHAAGSSDPVAFAVAQRALAVATLNYVRWLEATGSIPAIGLRDEAEMVLNRTPNRVAAFNERLDVSAVPGRVIAWATDWHDDSEVLTLVWQLPAPDGETWSVELADQLVALATQVFADDDLTVYVKFVAEDEVDALHLPTWAQLAA